MAFALQAVCSSLARLSVSCREGLNIAVYSLLLNTSVWWLVLQGDWDYSERTIFLVKQGFYHVNAEKGRLPKIFGMTASPVTKKGNDDACNLHMFKRLRYLSWWHFLWPPDSCFCLFRGEDMQRSCWATFWLRGRASSRGNTFASYIFNGLIVQQQKRAHLHSFMQSISVSFGEVFVLW